ncbi:hypothetical protein KAS42_02140 [bacterium]|nr:hypothetical protein [bacterium]
MAKSSKGIYGKPKKNFKLISLIILLLFVCGASIFLISNLTGKQKVNEPQAIPNQENPLPSPQTTQPSASATNPIAQAAVKAGVTSSIGRINQIVKFLTTNNQSGAYMFPIQNPPDEHVFSTSFEIITPDNAIIYATANFFPNQDTVYDTVEYVNKGGEELEKTVFKDLKRVGILKKNIIALDGGAVKIFLMPAGSGCIVIKKEIVQ